MDESIRFRYVLATLIDEKYRRNRKALAAEANISESAISQYTRGRATPSLDVLVKLASTLGVTLDYLVLGRGAPSASADTDGAMGRLMQELKSQVQADAATRYDLVARTGARLGQEIEVVVSQLVTETTLVGGTLRAEEAVALESCSDHSTVVTDRLEMEVTILEDASPGNEGAVRTTQAAFTKVIADNIDNGRGYDYFLPAEEISEDQVAALRKTIIDMTGRPPRYVNELLTVYLVDTSCVPEFTLYELPRYRLRRRSADLYDRVSPYFHSEDDASDSVYVATLSPASGSYDSYALIARSRVRRLVREVSQRRADAERGRNARAV